MEDQISKRFIELVQEGRQLVQRLPYDDEDGHGYWVNESRLTEYHSWICSSSNLIGVVANKSNIFQKESDRLLSDDQMKSGIPTNAVKKFLGLLESAHKEWTSGLLRDIEYVVAGATFDDFLDHAATYHKGNKIIESAVLASAVLEDTIKKISKKHKIETSGRSLEQLIDELVEQGTLTLVKAKRIKGFAGVRNYALHAEWDEFDIKDVGSMIKGLRELVADYL